MLDSVNSDLNTVIKQSHVVAIIGRKFEGLTPSQRHAGEIVDADMLDAVHGLAVIALLCGAVPACYHLTVMEHLEEVSGLRGVRTIDRILEPDLRAGVDRHVARGYRVVVGVESRAFILKRIGCLAWTEFGNLANLELGDDTHLNTSKFNHLVNRLSREKAMKRSWDFATGTMLSDQEMISSHAGAEAEW